MDAVSEEKHIVLYVYCMRMWRNTDSHWRGCTSNKRKAGDTNLEITQQKEKERSKHGEKNPHYRFISRRLAPLFSNREEGGYVECVFIIKSIACGSFLGDSQQHYSSKPSWPNLGQPRTFVWLAKLLWERSTMATTEKKGELMRWQDGVHACVCVCACVCVWVDAAHLFWFDVLRCGEDVGVGGALKDPVQRFQLLLGEGVSPKVFP